MASNKLTMGVLIILFVACVFASAHEASGASGHAFAQAVPTWQQTNSNGFGDQQNIEASALEAFNGYLYAGTHNPTDPLQTIDGAQIFRSPDGETWIPVTDPGFGNSHDTAPPAILAMTVFKGQLYAGTGRGNAAQIWRTQDGVNWSRVVNAGFGNPDIVDFSALAVYNQALYVGATEQDSGVQIWRTLVGDGNLNNWTEEATPAMPVPATASVSGMAVFDDGFGPGLYAAVSYGADTPALVWRSFGGGWETAVSDGFGDSNTITTGGMAAFAGDLYVGAGNKDSGAQLWRSSDGDNWVQATPAFGDGNDEKVEQVFVHQNQLYIGVTNTGSGIEIWRSSDPTNSSLWEQANLDGFGDSKNTTTNGSNATAAFLGQIYVGTSNVTDGGELWRMLEDYGVTLSPDQAKEGPAGEDVSYTLSITNNGQMADSFDLTATGQTWTTNLSTSLVNLASSASVDVTVTVAIPPGAADQESDAVTITATSQGDGSKSDSALLTTTAVLTPVYGVALSADESLSGPVGGQAIYTLTVTNAGTVADSFDLAATGQTWTTNLSTSLVNLASFASVDVTVTVAIPPGAADQESDAVTITATSQGDGSKSDSALLTTTAVLAPVYGVALSADESLSGPVGGQAIYTLTVTNSGTVADSFDLTATGQTWATNLSTSLVNLASSASVDVTVTVAIPPGAADQESDAVTITATSQGDGSKSDSALLTTTAVLAPVYGVALSADESLSGPAGGQALYTLTVTNAGTVADSFDLTATGQTWTTNLSTSLVNLASSASVDVTVTVAIPPGAADQESDAVTITATSQGDGSKSDSALLTTTAVLTPVYGVALSADESLSGPVGGQALYTLRVTNSGTVADSFDLAATGQTWTTNLSTSLVNLASSASVDVTVTVAIPPGAADQETDAVTITATSQGDGSKSDSALLTTTAVLAPVYGVALSADESLSGPAGGQAIYTLTVTNAGTVADIVDLQRTGNSWTTTFSSQSVPLAAGGSRAVMITVLIPPTAAAFESDRVTIQATSRHDGRQSDTTVLTTVSSGWPVKTYLPLVMLNAP